MLWRHKEKKMKRSNELKERARRLERTAFTEFWTLVVECSSVLNEIQPGRRRPFLQEVVGDLFREQNGLCGICGEQLTDDVANEIDHIIPFTYGGGNERNNIQLAHNLCNRRKRAQVDPRDLLKYLEDRYMNL